MLFNPGKSHRYIQGELVPDKNVFGLPPWSRLRLECWSGEGWCAFSLRLAYLAGSS